MSAEMLELIQILAMSWLTKFKQKFYGSSNLAQEQKSTIQFVVKTESDKHILEPAQFTINFKMWPHLTWP